jgi:WD40 repeat protein
MARLFLVIACLVLSLTSVPAEEKHASRTDCYGDLLPEGALARLGTMRLRRDDQSSDSLAFTPDGKVLISARTDRVIQFWETATGKPLRAFRQQDPFESFVLSKDGMLLVTGGSKGITIWDVTTGRVLRSIRKRYAKTLALSPDKQLLAGVLTSGERGIYLWDMATGMEKGELAGHTGEIKDLFFVPDKTLVSFAPGDAIRVWDVVGRKELRTIPIKLHDGRLSVSADGSSAACGGTEYVNNAARIRIVLWDLRSGRKVRQLHAHASRFQALSFSPNGRMLASTDSDRLHLWNASTGDQLRTIAGEASWSLAFSPDSRTLATTSHGTDAVIRLWDAATGWRLLVEGNQGLAVRVAFSPDGNTVATLPWGDHIRLWDAATGRPLRACEGRTVVTKALFMPDGKRLVSAEFGKLRLWNVQTGKEIRVYPTGYPVYGLSVSPDGKRLVSVSDHIGPGPGERGMAFAIWEVNTGRRLLEYQGQGQLRNLVSISPDARYIALPAGREVRLWNIANARQVLSLHTSKAPNEVVDEPIAFSRDGRTVAAVTHRRLGRGQPWEYAIYLWELATGQVSMRIAGMKTSLNALTFSADGRTLATGGEGTVQLWNVADGKELLARPVDDAYLRLGGLAFSPDGTKLAAGYGDTTALIWDMTPGSRRAGLPERELGAGDLEQLWSDLAGRDAARAHAAIWTLISAPEEILPWCKTKLQPVRPADAGQVRRLLTDLDSGNFAARDAASRALKKIGAPAESFLRAALENKPSLELRRRIELVLTRSPFVEEAESLRTLRAIQVLEQIGNPEAQGILQTLAQGVVAARETQDAKEAVERLRRRRLR